MKKLLLFLIMTCALFSDPVYVEPPIVFKDTPVKIALETIFLRVKVQYCIELSFWGCSNVTLNINKRIELDTLLTLILEPRGLAFKKDRAIYLIMRKETDNFSPIHKLTKRYALTSCWTEGPLTSMRRFAGREIISAVKDYNAENVEIGEALTEILTKVPGNTIKYTYLGFDVKKYGKEIGKVKAEIKKYPIYNAELGAFLDSVGLDYIQYPDDRYCIFKKRDVKVEGFTTIGLYYRNYGSYGDYLNTAMKYLTAYAILENDKENEGVIITDKIENIHELVRMTYNK